jgi:hypothetical protein
VRDFGPLPKKANGILSLRPSSRFSAFVLSFRLHPSDAFTLSFEHHLALELCHRGKHIEHEASGRSTSIHGTSAKVEDAERHAVCLELIHQFR